MIVYGTRESGATHCGLCRRPFDSMAVDRETVTTAQPLYAATAHQLALISESLAEVSPTGHATLDRDLGRLAHLARSTYGLASRLSDTTPKNWSAS